MRGPLPPFFGSSAEAAKVEIAPDPPPIQSMGTVPAAPEPTVPPPLPPEVGAPPEPPGGARGRNGDASRSSGAAGNSWDGPQGWPRATEAGINGKASSIFGTAADDGRAGGEAGPQMQGLEAMVAELLRPMLQRWLDENMPRLVAAALQAEIRREPKKT